MVTFQSPASNSDPRETDNFAGRAIFLHVAVCVGDIGQRKRAIEVDVESTAFDTVDDCLNNAAVRTALITLLE